MKKRLSLLSAVIIALPVAFLIGAGATWLSTRFNYPNWVFTLFQWVTVYSFFELVGRLGPKSFESPTSTFFRLSTRDRAVVVVAVLVFLIVALPIGTRFDSRWLKILFIGLGFLIAWSICFFFGSKALIHRKSKEQDKPHQQS